MIMEYKPGPVIMYCPIYNVEDGTLVDQPIDYPKIKVRKWDSGTSSNDIVLDTVMTEDFPGNYVYQWDINAILPGTYQVEYIGMVNGEEYSGFENLLINPERSEEESKLGNFINNNINYYVHEENSFIFKSSVPITDLKISIIDINNDLALITDEDMTELSNSPLNYKFNYTPNKITSLLIEVTSISLSLKDSMVIRMIPNPKDQVQKVHQI